MPFSGGRPETECGAGSTLANTVTIREWLPILLHQLGVRKLLDVPCGDFNWLARTDLSEIEYIGGNYDREHIARARSRESDPASYSPRNRAFIELDTVSDPLPAADLLLCRDFLQHLPNTSVMAVLRKFAAGRIPWLLATSHNNAENGDIATAGSFRPLNLSVAPFALRLPRQWVEDPPGSGRILGLWRREELN